MGFCTRVSALAALLVLPAVASAIPIQASTGTWVTMRDCIGPGGSCSELSPIASNSQYGGTPGGTASFATVTSPLYGTATASTALSGEAGAPLLTASATSEVGGRVNTNSFALQRYTYTGAVATTRSFGGTLTYSSTITDPLNATYGPAASGVYAEMRIFITDSAFAEAGGTAQSNNDLLFAFSHADGTAGFTLVGEASYGDQFSTSAGLAAPSITLGLNPGDSFWVWAFIQTPAADGSIVDASHTFITAWNNIENLMPAAQAHTVPEPGTLGPIALGLALAGLARRRRERLHVSG